ncbi:MAG: polyphosphate kinase 1 [Acidaminobacteraceae bacterium]
MYGNNKFFNREISWLEFNKRVLELSLNEKFPLLERLKFCSIFDSNLDEFFMVRIASIMDQIHAKYIEKDISGLTPKEQYSLIEIEVRKLKDEHEIILKNIVDSEFEKEGIKFLKSDELSKEQFEYIKKMFEEKIYPVLTPIAIDSKLVFPLILNASLNIIVMLEDKEETKYATVQVPGMLKRLIKLPSENLIEYITLEDVINTFIDLLFVGTNIIETALYRVTRNGDLTIHEDEAEDLLLVIENSLEKRKWGEIIRLEVNDDIDKKLLKILTKSMSISDEKIYRNQSYIDATLFDELVKNKRLSHLKLANDMCDDKIEISSKSLFNEIKKKDLFVNHPYDSFDIVTRFIEEASQDKSVLAIKQTLYRVGGDSPIINALSNAAKSGKQVTVLVELMARFDEETNINWAKELEKNGCHVIYGIVGLKTHSKITLVVRKEGKSIRRYVHMGTGNYNEETSKIYSDMGIFTSDEDFGSDVSELFNRLSGYSSLEHLDKIYTAPNYLRSKLIDLIDTEIENASLGKVAYIRAKMNALVDKKIIEKLYQALASGVNIELNVRGVCCLKPDEHENGSSISVVSIVGKELEHSRVFIFANDNNSKVYLSSADWMPRNLDRRTEIMFPVEDEIIKKRVELTLKLYMKDNMHAYTLNTDGTYNKRAQNNGIYIDSQKILSEICYLNSAEFIEKVESIMTNVAGG